MNELTEQMIEQAAEAKSPPDIGVGEGSGIASEVEAGISEEKLASEQENQSFSCSFCEESFETKSQLNGHQKRHRSKKGQKRQANAENAATNEALEKLEQERRQAEERAKAAEAQLKELRAKQEIEQRQPGNTDPVEREIIRLLRTRQINALAPEEKATPGSSHNGGDPVLLNRIQALERRNNELETQLHDKELSDKIISHVNQSLKGFEQNVKQEVESLRKSQTNDPKVKIIEEGFDTVKSELENLHAKSDVVLNWLLGPQAKQLPVSQTTPDPELEKLEKSGYLVES